MMSSIIKNRNYLLIIGIVSVSIFIRTYKISNESLYGDEPYSIFQAQKTLPELKEIFLHDQNPPLHITLLHFWIKAFGISDISAKMFSVICSVLAGLILLLFAKKHFGKTVAFIVIILFLFSNAQQFYATEVRPYALIQLLCISSFYFYFNIITSPQKKDIIYLFLTNTLLLYTHYLTIFIFVVQFLSIWLFIKENKKSFLYYCISQVIVAILFFPWINVLLSNIPKEGSFWSHSPNYDDFRWHTNLLLGNSKLFYVFSILVAVFLLLTMLNKKRNIFSEKFNLKYFIIFLLLFILPIALDFIAAQFTPVFLTRYILYSTFGLFLLIAYCLTYIKLNNIYKAIITIPILIYTLSSFQITQEREDDWKHFVPMVRKMKNEKTAILICASYKFKDFAFYYDSNAFKNYTNSAQLLAEKKVYFSPKDEWFGWEKLNYDSIEKIIYVQSHNQFEDPENKNIIFILSKGYIECESYRKINTGYTVYVKTGLECNPVKITSENENEKCDVFEKYLGIDSNMDSIEVFKTSFEQFINCKSIIGLCEENAYDGRFSLKINKENEYSPAITHSIKEINSKRIIEVNSFVFLKKGNNSHLVISCELEGKTLFRNDLYLPEKIVKEEKWEEIKTKVVLPDELSKEAILKIYFWNPSEKEILIDLIKITIY